MLLARQLLLNGWLPFGMGVPSMRPQPTPAWAIAALSTSSAAPADAPSTSGRRRWPGLTAADQAMQDLDYAALETALHQRMASTTTGLREAHLLLLLHKSASPEEVEAATKLARRNMLVRARHRQYGECSSRLGPALLAAGVRAGCGSDYAVRLLEQGPLLGFTPSDNLCRRVVKLCEAAGDADALQRAWLYARARSGRTPRPAVAVWVANALRGLGRDHAAARSLERHLAAGGRLSPMGQRVLEAVQASPQQAAATATATA